MVRTACKGSAGESKPPSPGRPVRPLLLLFLEVVLKNKRIYKRGWTSLCSTRSTTSPPQGKMEKYLLIPSGLRLKLKWAPSFIRGHLQTWRTQYDYQDDQEYTNTREHGIQTYRQLQGLLKRVWILYTQRPPMGLWIARPNVWPKFYPDLKTRM